MIDLARAKLQCRVESDDEDALLQGYIASARIGLEGYLKRKLYETAAALEAAADGTGLVMTEAHDQAMLLLIGEWYANREPTAGALPAAVAWLVEGDRFYTV
ncbi:head-tail connector protein [Burkholderia gladioli]|uniref:head-tail connector protein n=1 Tax=Burkholderia gladioli TaxID=28095 RepID=UPI00164200DC|nr:head-tail connector protein [Burkholderia gladioli]